MAKNNNFFINKYKTNKNSDKILDNEKEKQFFFEKIPQEDKKDFFISKKRLAALLLILSGIDKAVKIVKNFSKDELLKAVSEIIKIEKITQEEVDAVQKNFGSLNIDDLSKYKGGKEFAIELLQKALGMKEGSAFFLKCVEESNDKALSFLESINPEEIYDLISNESPSVIAIVLGLLNPKISSNVLPFFKKDKLPEIIKKMSSKLEINSEALDVIVSSLKEKFKEYQTNKTINISGKKKLIEILKNADPDKAESIIKELSLQDEDLAKELEESIFTFDDIIFLTNEDLEKALKKYSDKDIAFILKGAEERIKDKFLSCMTKRRKELIIQEMEYLGKVRKEDVIEKRKDFIQYLKNMEKNNEIILRPDREKYIT